MFFIYGLSPKGSYNIWSPQWQLVVGGRNWGTPAGFPISKINQYSPLTPPFICAGSVEILSLVFTSLQGAMLKRANPCWEEREEFSARPTVPGIECKLSICRWWCFGAPSILSQCPLLLVLCLLTLPSVVLRFHFLSSPWPKVVYQTVNDKLPYTLLHRESGFYFDVWHAANYGCVEQISTHWYSYREVNNYRIYFCWVV